MINPLGQLAIYQLLCFNVNTGDFTKLEMPVHMLAWSKNRHSGDSIQGDLFSG